MATNRAIQFKIIKGPTHIKIQSYRHLGSGKYEVKFHPDSQMTVQHYVGELTIQAIDASTNLALATWTMHLISEGMPAFTPLPLTIWDEGVGHKEKQIILNIKQKYNRRREAFDFEWDLVNPPSWLEIERSGIIDIKEGETAKPGRYTLKVKITDRKNNKTSFQDVLLQVNPIDLSPILKDIPNNKINLNVYEYTELTKKLEIINPAKDKEKNPLSVVLLHDGSEIEGLNYNEPTQTLYGTPTKSGIYNYTLLFSNNTNKTLAVEITINVLPSEATENAPIISSVPNDLELQMGENLNFQVQVSNPQENAPLEYNLEGLFNAGWVQLDSDSGLLTGTPETYYPTKGVIIVTNALGKSAKKRFSILIIDKTKEKEKDENEEKKPVKTKNIIAREKAILEAALTGDLSILLKMPDRDDVPNYTKELLDKGKEYLTDATYSLGIWTVDKLDHHVLIPFKDWGEVKIKAPIRKKKRQLSDSIKNKIESSGIKNHSTFRNIKAVRIKLKRFKKAGGKSSILFILSQVVKTALDNIGETIETAKDIVSKVPGIKSLKNAFGNTRTGRFVEILASQLPKTNMFKRAAAAIGSDGALKLESGLQKFKGEVTRMYRGFGDQANKIIVPIKTVFGKFAPAIRGAGAIVKNTLSFRAIGSGGIAGLAVYVAGGNPLIVGAVGVLGTGVGAINNAILHQSDDIGGALGSLAKKYGSNQFKYSNIIEASPATQQSLLQELENRGGNTMHKVGRSFRVAGSAMNFGAIGYTIASLVPGLQPFAVGIGLASATVGGTGQFVYDKVVGKLKGTGIKALINLDPTDVTPLTRLASFPMSTALNMVHGNFWLLNEMNKLFDTYDGDFGQYFKENWTSKNRLQTFVNLAGTIGYISSMWQMAKSMASGTWLAGTAAQTGLKAISRFKLTGSMLIGGVLGSAIGLMLASAFGIPLGAGALLGAAIGGTIGTIGGAILSGVIGGSTGVGFLASTAIITVTTAFGTTLGAWLGSFFDKGLKSLTSAIMGTMNAIQSMLALTKFLSSPLNADNIVMFLFSIISLMTVLERAADQSGSSDNATPADPDTAQFGESNLNEIKLEHYNISLIDGQEDTWDRLQISRLLSVLGDLEQNGDAFDSTNKSVFITLGEGSIYEGEEFVLISIPSDKFYRLEYNKLLSKELEALGNLDAKSDNSLSFASY